MKLKTCLSMTRNNCIECKQPIPGVWDSQLALGFATGELTSQSFGNSIPALMFAGFRDKHIRCSPSRAQRIVHDRFPAAVDERPEFDWRLWDDAKREHWREVYTSAWIALQKEWNPKWKDGQPDDAYYAREIALG